MSENFSLLHSLDPRHNTAKGTYTFQLMKVFATKYEELDNIMATIASVVNIQNSYGFELDYHGIEAGIFRKSAERATCRIKCTGKANGFLIPIGSTFSTKKGISYYTTLNAVLPNIISIKKGPAGTVDAIPYPYSNVQKISWINTTPSQTGIAYDETTDWIFANDEIDWSPGGDEPAENTVYYIGLDTADNISVSIDTVASQPGDFTRVSAGMITVNTDGLSGISEVTNEVDSVGGTNQELDLSYRNRLLRTSRTQYGYERIRALVTGLNPVRASNVYQDTGVDQAYPTTDWTLPSTWTTFNDINLYGANDVVYAQTFKPEDDVITIAKISLYVKKVGKPVPFTVSLYLWVIDYTTTISAAPLYWQNFSKDDVNPDNPSGWNEAQIKSRFGGLDYTKTYMITIESSDPGTDDVSNHWEFKYMNSGNPYANGALYRAGVLVNSGNADLAFKTRWGGASFSIVVALNQGEYFPTVRDLIETEITDFEKKAYTPICIQANIREAFTAYINVTCTIYKDTASDWDMIQNMARENIYNYLLGLQPGDNVYFSAIEKAIYTVPGVLKITGCTIQKNSETPISKTTEDDILISPDEIAILGSPGTTFTLGEF